ncbi:hypothetical protein E2562_026689 [Oryza meyeriana var. granulata]|uniref:Uncharacterized protein n=1 Tax=Oryza meyeriana var. granulata TaxID=110450 RepID=A0A6G1E361_9ORYZ|nr:hypothetical protein E2562_026689 [Oryza meyeriana var. granulata]
MVTEGLVPITRAYLVRYYDKYPLPPLLDATTSLADRLRTLSAGFTAIAPITSGELPPNSFPWISPAISLLASPPAKKEEGVRWRMRRPRCVDRAAH